MLLRHDYEERERLNLSPYAAISSASRGRQHKESECKFRSAFQRDRDRIIHSEAFRRLEYKTQVFVNHEGDYYRTRLTHSLEVAQMSRSLARTLRLNEDLAESVALAHDLGHTPFGHAGEDALNKLMKNFGGFEHNYQSYRVVTKLEHRYKNFAGLNLTFEVLEGIVKHSGDLENPFVKNFPIKGFPTIEAQVVNIADKIAYLNHDLDDGLESGLLKFEQLNDLLLWQRMLKECGDYASLSKKLFKYHIVRHLIYLFVTDLQKETERQIAVRKIKTLNDVRKNGKDIVCFSPKLKSEIKALKNFLYKNLYHHPKVKKMEDHAQKVVENLFKAYKKNKKSEREICDYIAGMTDRFALLEHQRLCE